MREPRHRTTKPQRPDPAGSIPDPLSRALLRRQTLDEQQRDFQVDGTGADPHRSGPRD